MKKIYKLFTWLLAGSMAFAACTDGYMERLNTDDTKASDLDPNNQLTTALLSTYGDFLLMDTYRSYITGFTQYFAGAWNVSNFAGAVYAKNDVMSHIWDRYYSVGIKNLVDAIYRTEEKGMINTNAALRIHRVYLFSILTDTYGDVPCTEAGKGFIEGLNNPKYDTQEEIYNWMFEELATCVDLLGAGTDKISGDVTSLKGNTTMWKKYANSLRMRFAMRISDINPEKAKQEFESAMIADGGYIKSNDENAYVIHLEAPFTLYDGAQDYDFRANAYGEILYGQDPESPTFVCATLFNMMEEMNDPRLYRIVRHYIHTTRSQTSTEGNIDVTEEVVAWEKRSGQGPFPCNVGDAWWSEWATPPAIEEIPTLARLVAENPSAGYDQSNYPARMIRPSFAVEFEKAECPGILITAPEIQLLLAEAATKGWDVFGTVEEHYEKGIRYAMDMLNEYYDIEKITEEEINEYIAANPLSDNPKADINIQAWLLHITNPSEAWANVRRSDYPALMDRTKLPIRSDFPHEDPNMNTPTRLKYPNLEQNYNSEEYNKAIERLGGTDDWHKHLWWDVYDMNVYDPSI